MNKELQNAREDYKKHFLDIDDVKPEAMDQFMHWFDEYKSLNIKDYNAMTLSTVDGNNKPSSRVVLLKGISTTGFEFYTNYNSDKARDIDGNAHVALNFFWPEIERQVRVEGQAHKLSANESDFYFNVRPRASKIGAWVSPQSQIIPNRSVLEAKQLELDQEFGENVQRPPHWGGYRIVPEKVEFWQGRSSRLHDRIVYKKKEDGSWEINRLAP